MQTQTPDTPDKPNQTKNPNCPNLHSPSQTIPHFKLLPKIILHRQNHHQRRHRNRKRNQRRQQNRAPTRRKLALNNPVLALQEPVVSQQQNQNADSQKGRAERLAQVSQRVGLARVVGQRRVEAEELRDGYADGGKG